MSRKLFNLIARIARSHELREKPSYKKTIKFNRKVKIDFKLIDKNEKLSY